MYNYAKFKHIALGTILLMLVFSVTAFGSASDRLLRSLKPEGLVSDYAGVFSRSQERELEGQLQQFEQQTSIEIAVVSLKTMKGGDIDDFGNRLFEQWEIGKKGKDNGVLLLAVIQDRKVRIEVGYGLEGVLPDGAAGRIRDADIIPYFKQGDYAAGLTRGALAIATRVSEGAYKTDNMPPSPRPVKKKKSLLDTFFSIIFFLVLAVIFVRHPMLFFLLLSSGGGGGGRRSGGGFGGGGFGGGMSGGGGASGSW